MNEDRQRGCVRVCLSEREKECVHVSECVCLGEGESVLVSTRGQACVRVQGCAHVCVCVYCLE